MMIDENDVRKKSQSLMGGFKGVVPRLGAKKKLGVLDYFRMAVGICLAASLAAGTIILIANLVSVGKDLAQRKSKPQKVEYVEVIFKPKSGK